MKTWKTSSIVWLLCVLSKEHLVQGFLRPFVGVGHVSSSWHLPRTRHTSNRRSAGVRLDKMKRPILDQLASFVFRLESDRVKNSSVVDDKGRMGEPMEWSEKESLANKFSEMIASNDIGYTMKQFIADLVAGKDFDQEQTAREIDAFIETHPVAMYAFKSCPFCRRAKDYLEERGIPYTAIDLDLLDGNRGNEIRAILGRKTRRTSMPAIFIGTTFIGGCNDGPGLLPLAASGELDKLLQDAKVSFSR